MTHRWRRIALTTAATTAGTMLFFTGQAVAEPAPAAPNGSPIQLADEPAADEFATRVDLTMPTQVKTGLEFDIKAQVFGIEADKGVNGGMFQFVVDGAPVGDQKKAGSTGLFTFKHTFTTSGPHTVTVQYLGGGTINKIPGTAAASSADGGIGASEQDVATVVEILPNTDAIETGVQTTLKAKVSLQSGGILPYKSGNKVTFYDGDVELGTANTVSSADGTANIKATFLHAGTRTVTAKFLGNAFGYAASESAPTPIEVQHKDLATSISLLAPNTGKAGQPVTFTATVSAQIPVDGTVQFRSGETPIGDAVPVVDGEATGTHIFDDAGDHTITAVFTGTGFATSTSNPAPLNISPAQPGDTVTTVNAPAATLPAIPVTLTATVAPAPYGGTIQFYVGDTAIGAPVPVVNGFASTTHSFAQTGKFTVTARYSGHTAANESTSAPATVSVGVPGVDTGSLELPSFGSLGQLPFGS
ncbi:Ig-like domain-containing protein [Prescottella subtropica]|uniref:Ig-like domain-containing protein n=1 Tax=Prescottella subtropica TaxID=2545757 RepID=UPI0010F7FE17|nr:Ig-like domain-containing protein [Prescottella subtropica]